MVEVVLGSFARHALHRHMYDYLGAIQCQSGVFPNFAFNVRGHSLARLQGTLINTFLTIEGPSSVDKGFFPVSLSMVESQVFCKIRLIYKCLTISAI